jgi:hypothetical protein
MKSLVYALVAIVVLVIGGTATSLALLERQRPASQP